MPASRMPWWRPVGATGVSDGYFVEPTVVVRQTYVEEINSP